MVNPRYFPSIGNTIAIRLGIYFFLVSLVPLAVFGYIAYRIAEESQREEAVNGLLALTEEKAKSIETYALERRRNITMLSRDPTIVDAIESYREALRIRDTDRGAYAAVDEELKPFLTYYAESAGYADLFLVTPEEEIVFSLNDRGAPRQRDQSAAGEQSELMTTINRAATLLETEISDFGLDPLTGRPVAFIAAPVFKDQRLAGLVAFQLRNEEVYDLARDYTGLGRTGEIVVASDIDNEAVFVAPVRHDPQAAFGRRIPAGSEAGSPILKAIHAQKGSGVSLDYRGQSVLAAWRYLPSFRWGIVVKIDTEEAFAPITRLRNWWLGLGLLVGLSVIVLTVVLARSISIPIGRLTRTTKRLASGDLTASLDVHSSDEIGELAKSFRHMQQALLQSIEHLKETTAAKERIESELKIAREIQMGILPKIFPPFPHRPEFDIYATIEPAREVGGDFYDFVLIDDERLCFAIGDVSGKGVPASLFMAVTTTLLKVATNRLSRPDAILAEVNDQLCRDNESAMFVTMFFGMLHVHTGKLEYSNGGHNLPYLLAPPERIAPLENTGGMALGVMEDVEYRTKTIVLRPGDGIFLYTDGVTEAMDRAGNLFSDQRLQEFLHHLNSTVPTVIIQETLEVVKRFAEGAEQSDDITALAIKYVQAPELIG